MGLHEKQKEGLIIMISTILFVVVGSYLYQKTNSREGLRAIK